MNTRRILRWRWPALLLILALATACNNTSCDVRPAGENEPVRPFLTVNQDRGVDSSLPVVVCTTALAAEIVDRLGEGFVRTETLVRRGEDPHAYRPRPEDVVRIRGSLFVLGMGKGFETRMGELLDVAGFRAVLLAENPALQWVDEPGREPNPHVWWSVPNDMIFVAHVRETLIRMKPEHADAIRERAEAYLAELRELDANVRAATALIPQDRRVIVTLHRGLDAFAKEYGYRTEAVMGEHTLMQVSPERLEEVARFVVDNKAPALFVESAAGAAANDWLRRVAEVAKEKYGADVPVTGSVYTDNLDNLSRITGTYVGAVKANVIVFVKYLGGTDPPAYFVQ